MIKWCLLGILLSSALVSAETLRVATYNLKNYLLTDRMVDGRWRSEYPKPESERQALYQVIQAVNPDVLAIQEIGGKEYLAALQRDLNRLGLDYAYSYLGQGEDAVRFTAVLSRIEADAVMQHTALDFPYLGQRVAPRRGLLEVQMDGFSLYVIHLKSRFTTDKRDPGSEERRTKEAQAIRDRIRERHGEGEDATPYLVLGDFNDLINSSTLRRFLSVGGRDLAQPLDVADSRDEVWTYFWDKADQYARIDFILASPPMSERWENASKRGGVYDGQGSRQASDHRLVWADFSKN